jgi:hypothetical protein
MTDAAERGVTMRVSRRLRDIIQHLQRTESVKQNRSLTVVETTDLVATLLNSYGLTSTSQNHHLQDTNK